jgi:HlyD family secretion protein
MRESARPSWTRTRCPSCGRSISWYDLLTNVGFSLQCPHCKAKLRLDRPYQVAVGFGLAACAALAVLLGLVFLWPLPVDGVVLQVNIRPGERISELDTKALMVLGDIRTFHVWVDVDERDIPRFRPGAKASAYPRGETSHALGLRFVRVEPLAIPNKALTGDNTERVDTRVLQVLYAIDRADHPVYVGQQLDVFIDSGKAIADTRAPR